jgi:hypothetical protein
MCQAECVVLFMQRYICCSSNKTKVQHNAVNTKQQLKFYCIYTVKTAKFLLFFSMARQPLGGLDRLIVRGFTITL